MLAVIGAFDVVRLRDELVMKVPSMPALEVWISMFVALTDWARQVSDQEFLGSVWAHPNSNRHV